MRPNSIKRERIKVVKKKKEAEKRNPIEVNVDNSGISLEFSDYLQYFNIIRKFIYNISDHVSMNMMTA